MSGAKRRLTIYPGQVSLVFNIRHAEEFLQIFKENLPLISEKDRSTAKRFLSKMESSIETGKRLSAKQSAIARGNSQQ